MFAVVAGEEWSAGLPSRVRVEGPRVSGGENRGVLHGVRRLGLRRGSSLHGPSLPALRLWGVQGIQRMKMVVVPSGSMSQYSG